MIYSVEGILRLVEPNYIVLETGGIGFGIKTTMHTIGTLPSCGEKAKVYTYMNVREDAMELFGFADRTEEQSFRMLISVSGVGPKAALMILSEFTPERFALLVAEGDAKSLVRVPGIGNKTAQRIILELKDKVSKEQVVQGIKDPSTPTVFAGSDSLTEAVHALMVLGYTQREAAGALQDAPTDATVEDLIKHGLRKLASKR